MALRLRYVWIVMGVIFPLLHPAAGGAAPPRPIIAAGDDHPLAIRKDGSLWAWGYKNYGQLGPGNTTNRSSPAQVTWPHANPGLNLLISDN